MNKETLELLLLLSHVGIGMFWGHMAAKEKVTLGQALALTTLSSILWSIVTTLMRG